MTYCILHYKSVKWSDDSHGWIQWLSQQIKLTNSRWQELWDIYIQMRVIYIWFSGSDNKSRLLSSLTTAMPYSTLLLSKVAYYSPCCMDLKLEAFILVWQREKFYFCQKNWQQYLCQVAVIYYKWIWIWK